MEVKAEYHNKYCNCPKCVFENIEEPPVVRVATDGRRCKDCHWPIYPELGDVGIRCTYCREIHDEEQAQERLVAKLAARQAQLEVAKPRRRKYGSLAAMYLWVTYSVVLVLTGLAITLLLDTH
jgi:hypothetical protein